MPAALRTTLSAQGRGWARMAETVHMNYTGHVAPGDPPATRHLPNLTIRKLSVGPMDNNTYLLRDKPLGINY